MRTLGIALDLSKNVALERLQLNIGLFTLPPALEWICQTLRTLTSPAFSQLVIRGVHGLWDPKTTNLWKAVDELLSVLAARNPHFRVVFRTVFSQFPDDASCTYDEIRSFAASCLPLVFSEGLVKFEYGLDVEDRRWELGYLYLG